MIDPPAFGNRLAEYRLSADLSQRELAERSGLSVRAVSNLERGRTRWPYPATVHRLADALELHDQARVHFIAAASRRLAAASVITAGEDRPSQAGSGRVVPRQLPASPPQFAGRKAELTALTGLLSPVHADSPATVVISAICGTAGVGKTALAVHWAHRAANRFPDGQLYLNLRGFHPSGRPMPTAEAIRFLLDAMQVPAEQIPRSLDAQAALYRSLLSGRRMLVVLDNAHDAEQVRPLLPGSPGCLVLVTSRNPLAGLVASEGAYQLTLDLLTETAAHELLALRLGRAWLGTAPDVAAELVKVCARLPLALAIAAARISARPRLAPGAFTEELKDARRRLDALDTGDAVANVRAVFSWSLASLSAPAGQLFWLLGLHPGPDITIPAAASLAGMPPSQARRALSELAEAHLITEHAPSRFAMHDLLRAFAAEQAATYDAQDQRAAIHRMLDYYLHTSRAANGVLYPGRDPLTLPVPQTGAVPEILTDVQRAQSWLQAECRVLLAVVTQAADLSFNNHAWQIPYYLAMFLDFQGLWAEWAAAQLIALTSAQRLGNISAQARLYVISSHICMRLGTEQDAYTHLENALRLYRQLQDDIGQARIHVAFSLVLNHQSKHSDAFGHAQQALILYWANRHRSGMAQALNAIGWSEAHMDNPQRAVACCREAISRHREAGNRLGEAEGWDSLGYAYHRLGDHHLAIECYERAIDGHRQLASSHQEAITRTRLGDAHLSSGHPERARASWERALAIFKGEHHPNAGPVRRRLQYLGNEANGNSDETKRSVSASFFEPVD
jgi:tetratricopeptide (TPR) repeat protein/DNA-binding XRE family transcriptional regulator